MQLQQIVEVGDSTTPTKSHMEDTIKGAITRKMTTSSSGGLGGLVAREEDEVMEFAKKLEKSRLCSCPCFPCFPCFGKGAGKSTVNDTDGEMIELGVKYERV